MRNLSEAKVYGGIGAILMLVGIFIPYGGPIISIIGLVFIFIAVKAISEILSFRYLGFRFRRDSSSSAEAVSSGSVFTCP